MSQMMRQSTPTDPLVFDDEEAIGALASSAMHAHGRLFASGKCYTTCMTGDRAALIHGRIESVLSNAFCTIFGQSPIDRFSDILDQASYIAEHMAKDTNRIPDSRTPGRLTSDRALHQLSRHYRDVPSTYAITLVLKCNYI